MANWKELDEWDILFGGCQHVTLIWSPYLRAYACERCNEIAYEKDLDNLVFSMQAGQVNVPARFQNFSETEKILIARNYLTLGNDVLQ